MTRIVQPADFTPSRAAGLARLAAFVPRSGTQYRDNRNFDLGPDDRSNISALSAHIRHRLITEEEVCEAVLARFAPSTAEKFIQEVFWRTYWKGWLEMRPGVWHRCQSDVASMLAGPAARGGLAKALVEAEEGRTGIDAFDAWANELLETGWLHNHARMWFASIWIFTLKLPWQLGADFFLRHLIDGDPASNTLSWRWVAGLHTRGKTYLARASNIAEFTNARFRPSGLSPVAEPLAWDEPPSAAPLRFRAGPSGAACLLLVTEEDCSPIVPPQAVGFVTLRLTDRRSPRGAGPVASTFAAGALADARSRLVASGLCDRGAFESGALPSSLIDMARDAGASEIVTMHAPVGPVATALDKLAEAGTAAGVPLRALVRDWDGRAWPHARAGFFGFKERIPALLEACDYDKAPAFL
jgi:deoxyribodipyrimidine photo-lyase